MKKAQPAGNQEKFDQLRVRAERALAQIPVQENVLLGKDLQVVFQELQLTQIELEMQNDELRNANEELEIERLKFAGIYDLAPVGYFILNDAGMVEEVNTAGIRLLERAKKNTISQNFAAFVLPEQRDNYYLFFKDMQASPEKKSGQFQLLSKSGRVFNVLIEARAVPASRQCYVAVIDVSETIVLQHDLKEATHRLRLSLGAAAAGVWELSLPGMSFYLDDHNKKFCNANGGGFDGTYTGFIGLVHADDRHLVDQHFRTAINREAEIDISCRFTGRRGEVRFGSIRGHLVPTETDAHHFTGIIWDITEKALYEEKAVASRRQKQKEILAATLQAEQRERQRISEALHDSISQTLYGIKLQLAETEPANFSENIVKVNELIGQAIRECRNISFELAPPVLAERGLPETLRELCDRLSTPKLSIVSDSTGFNSRSDLVLELTVFHTIQELVNNGMKHAKASQINIMLSKTHTINIVVSDNGRGFDPQILKNKTDAAGLSSIRNRLAFYNGRMEVDSMPGHGTTIKISLDPNRSAHE